MNFKPAFQKILKVILNKDVKPNIIKESNEKINLKWRTVSQKEEQTSVMEKQCSDRNQ